MIHIYIISLIVVYFLIYVLCCNTFDSRRSVEFDILYNGVPNITSVLLSRLPAQSLDTLYIKMILFGTHYYLHAINPICVHNVTVQASPTVLIQSTKCKSDNE